MWAEEGPCEDREKMAVFETTREASQETTPAGSLNMDFQPLELTENKFLLLSHQACGILLRKPRQTNTARFGRSTTQQS